MSCYISVRFRDDVLMRSNAAPCTEQSSINDNFVVSDSLVRGCRILQTFRTALAAVPKCSDSAHTG